VITFSTFYNEDFSVIQRCQAMLIGSSIYIERTFIDKLEKEKEEERERERVKCKF